MNKKGRKGIWKLTPYGINVKKRLLEQNMTISCLAQYLGASESFLSQMLYGHKKGEKYINAINEYLDIQSDYDTNASCE